MNEAPSHRGARDGAISVEELRFTAFVNTQILVSTMPCVRSTPIPLPAATRIRANIGMNAISAGRRSRA